MRDRTASGQIQASLVAFTMTRASDSPAAVYMQSIRVGAEAISGMCKQMKEWADRVGKPKSQNKILLPEGLQEKVLPEFYPRRLTACVACQWILSFSLPSQDFESRWGCREPTGLIRTPHNNCCLRLEISTFMGAEGHRPHCDSTQLFAFLAFAAAQVEALVLDKLDQAFRISKKLERGAVTSALQEQLTMSLCNSTEGPCYNEVDVSKAFKVRMARLHKRPETVEGGTSPSTHQCCRASSFGIILQLFCSILFYPACECETCEPMSDRSVDLPVCLRTVAARLSGTWR